MIDLVIERGIVTALATNGSGAIHDFELALIGETSEDVAAGLKDGTFGMVRETGERMHAAIAGVKDAERRRRGTRRVVRPAPHRHRRAERRRESWRSPAGERGVPFTVHVAIGTDIIHMHPAADGAAHRDWRVSTISNCFAARSPDSSGGVYLNIGSAVIMPEVFLKAFTVAQNLGRESQRVTSTVNMDMIAHYRSGENVVRRPAGVAGKGYTLIGRHEFLLPLLAQAVRRG